MKSRSHFPLLLAPVLILFILTLYVSCNEELQTIPKVDAMQILPDTVEAGGVALIVTTAMDEDGDELVYSYSATGGKISGYGDSVYWLAPFDGGVYNAIVRVTDPDGNQSIDSVKLVVLDSGKSEITGTASFPAGLNYDLSGAVVRLFTSVSAYTSGQCADSVIAFGFGPIVSYRFPQVEPGTYYLDVWKDLDNSITMSSGDFIGWYGSGDFADPFLKPIVVQPGTPSQIQIQVQVKP